MSGAKTILLVDDDHATLKYVGLILENEGYRVVVAHDGEEALLKVRDSHPDLIDDVLKQSVEIERDGLSSWAKREKVDEAVALQTLITGLSVRFYTALASGE